MSEDTQAKTCCEADFRVRDDVREYYGETWKTNADLRTTACCSTSAMPQHLRDRAALLHPEVTGTGAAGC